MYLLQLLLAAAAVVVVLLFSEWKAIAIHFQRPLSMDMCVHNTIIQQHFSRNYLLLLLLLLLKHCSIPDL